MSGPKRWTVEETEFLQDCRVFSVSRQHARSPRTGRTHPFFRIDAPEWVNVVPLTPEGDVVMIRQFRHGSGDLTLETPGGMVDPGETPAEAGARELLEETGYRGGALVPIGGVNPNPALFGNRLHAFVAPDVERVAEVRFTGTEETAVEVVPRRELDRLVATGHVDHALVVAVLYLHDLVERAGDRRGR